jgi:hypothetical protein
MLELEYSDDHFAAKHVLARRANPAASLSTETGGDLALSGRWDEVMRPRAATRLAPGDGSRLTGTELTGGSKPATLSSSRVSAQVSAPRFAVA